MRIGSPRQCPGMSRLREAGPTPGTAAPAAAIMVGMNGMPNPIGRLAGIRSTASAMYRMIYIWNSNYYIAGIVGIAGPSHLRRREINM